ncbi:MAG: stage II sporulation protein M [Candidatus Bathyarchaeia archaeon]
MPPCPFPSDTKGWIKISTIGFLVSYVVATSLGLAFPSYVSFFTQTFINFLGGAKGGIWTNEQIFWHVLTWNTMVVFIILAMGVLALSFTYPVSFGFFVGLTAGTWCYRHGVPFNPWTLVMIPWGTHGWIEATYMILASGITMKIGTEIYGIRNRRDLLKHILSSPRPVPGWKNTIRPALKRTIILYLCLIIPAVAFGAFFEAYITEFIFDWFYPA